MCSPRCISKLPLTTSQKSVWREAECFMVTAAASVRIIAGDGSQGNDLSNLVRESDISKVSSISFAST
jgi:hypothetical protein